MFCSLPQNCEQLLPAVDFEKFHTVIYVNNAGSDSDDTIVAINFTNQYYKYFSTNSLNSLLQIKKPKVFHVNELVEQLRFTFGANSGWNDSASNYFLYKPLSPYNSGEESVPDNAIEMFNYLSTGAVDKFGEPNFIFWTGMAGDVNFKSFKRNIADDASYASMDGDVRNVGIFKGDAVIQKLSDKKKYRNAYFVASNPVSQYYTWMIGLGSDYNYTLFGAQFCLPRNVANPILSIRYRDNSGAWGGWSG